MLEQPTVISAQELCSSKFKEFLAVEKSRGVNYHMHALSDGSLVLCPPGTPIETEDGVKYQVRENGSLEYLSGKRLSRAKQKKLRRKYEKLGIECKFVE